MLPAESFTADLICPDWKFTIDRLASNIWGDQANVYVHSKAACYLKCFYSTSAWIGEDIMISPRSKTPSYWYLLHIRVCLVAKHFNRIAKSMFSCVTWPWYRAHVPIETNRDCRPKRDFLGNKINRMLALKLKGRILYNTGIISNRGSNVIFGQHLSVDL